MKNCCSVGTSWVLLEVPPHGGGPWPETIRRVAEWCGRDAGRRSVGVGSRGGTWAHTHAVGVRARWWVICQRECWHRGANVRIFRDKNLFERLILSLKKLQFGSQRIGSFNNPNIGWIWIFKWTYVVAFYYKLDKKNIGKIVGLRNIILQWYCSYFMTTRDQQKKFPTTRGFPFGCISGENHLFV